MAIVRWDPAREVDSLQSEVNRLFDTTFGGRPANGGPLWRIVDATDREAGRAASTAGFSRVSAIQSRFPGLDLT